MDILTCKNKESFNKISNYFTVTEKKFAIVWYHPNR